MPALAEALFDGTPGTVLVLGIPFDGNSSFLPGAATAPGSIRAAFRSPSTNLCTELGVDLGESGGWEDAGDLLLQGPQAHMEEIELAVLTALDRKARVLSLGGDHSVTHPIMRAYGKAQRPLTLVQLDAHPDLYDDLDGNRYSHACSFARIMEEGLVDRLVQVGVRTSTPHQRAQADRFGVETIEMHEWVPGQSIAVEGPCYLSLDLDVLDPAFAPGVSHQEPGGMSLRDVLGVLAAIPGPIVGADIVEYNPSRDLNGVTGMVAAKLLKELLARMLPGAV